MHNSRFIVCKKMTLLQSTWRAEPLHQPSGVVGELTCQCRRMARYWNSLLLVGSPDVERRCAYRLGPSTQQRDSTPRLPACSRPSFSGSTRLQGCGSGGQGQRLRNSGCDVARRMHFHAHICLEFNQR